MKSQLDLMIKGHGPVAQSLALALSSMHYKVGLSAPFGQTSELQNHQITHAPSLDSRFFALGPRSKTFLQELNAWPDECFCTPLLAMHIHCDRGEVIHLSSKAERPLAHIVSAKGLSEQLNNAIKKEVWIEELQSVSQAHLPLTLICEGRLSTSRKTLGVTYESMPYQQVAVSGNVQASKQHQQIAHQWFLNSTHGNEILALLPSNGPHSNHYSFVWSQPAHMAQLRMQLSPEEFSHALLEATGSPIGPLQCLDTPRSWPLIKAKAHQWVGQYAQGSSWCLLGDAAHSVHPLAGMGLNLGFDDALEMARLLKQRLQKGSPKPLSDLHLLRHFERARKAQLLPPWVAMDAIQRLFTHTHPIVESIRNWGAWGFENTAFLKDFVIQKASALEL